jgi:hypothetical protein
MMVFTVRSWYQKLSGEDKFLFIPGYILDKFYCTYFWIVMAALPLVNSVLSRHKPPLWDNMTYDKKVLLQEVDISSHEYERVKNMIRKTLSVDVSRVQRVQNPYLYGKCGTPVAGHSNFVEQCHFTLNA